MSGRRESVWNMLLRKDAVVSLPASRMLRSSCRVRVLDEGISASRDWRNVAASASLESGREEDASSTYLSMNARVVCQ